MYIYDPNPNTYQNDFRVFTMMGSTACKWATAHVQQNNIPSHFLFVSHNTSSFTLICSPRSITHL